MIDESIYTYKRKTAVQDGVLEFSFKYDLTQEITEIDLADMIFYVCQSDFRLQKICNIFGYGENSSMDDLLKILNAYRQLLLEEGK